MKHLIARIDPGSIAEELEIEAGDYVLAVDDQEIEDVFDWRTLTGDEEFVLLIEKKNGEEWELEIEKDPYEDLGIVFASDLMSDYRRCSNACIFCFIDQMPPGMRETLYFKDDDSRLSFLQGNYITLTNMQEKDVERIIRYHMEPMNISVHTTEPELRCSMLKNRFAGKCLRYLDRFYEAGLRMNMQIVLCRGVNDGEHLERTLSDLYRYVPVLESLSVVPVGLTRYREGLYPLEPFSPEECRSVIETVEKWQKKAYREHGMHFVHASDEFYVTAELEVPEEERYDGYLQIENGVGMVRSLYEEAKTVLSELDADGVKRSVTFATGRMAAPMLEYVRGLADHKFPGHDNRIIGIRNDFFGELITVAGLVTGQDLIAQLEGRKLGDLLVIPGCMLRSGEDVFLDDVHLSEVTEKLKTPVAVLRNGGGPLVRVMLGMETPEDFDTTHGEYELKSLSGEPVYRGKNPEKASGSEDKTEG